MSYEPVDIVRVARVLADNWNVPPSTFTLLNLTDRLDEWRDALVAELERLADQPLDLYPTWFAASNLAYRHAARLVRGEAIQSQTSNDTEGGET